MQHIHVTDSSLDPPQYGNCKESTPLGLGAQAESARLLTDKTSHSVGQGPHLFGILQSNRRAVQLAGMGWRWSTVYRSHSSISEQPSM